MKKSLFILTLALMLTRFASAQTHRFLFEVKDKSELKKITRIVSIDNVKGNKVWAYANDKEFAEFSKLGYKAEELPLNDNAGKVINMATTVAQMASWDRYPTYEVYIEMMNKFASDYPALCQVVNIGTSAEGRQLIALKISDNVATHELEPEYFYTGTMHGDETTGMVLLLRLADWLLSNYGTNTDANFIVDNFELYINPAANPDGTYAGGNSTVSGATRGYANGDDPNRDFPYPLEPNYTSSNVETNAMIAFAQAHHFVMSANFHGGTEVMNYPWDCWTSAENAHADTDWFEKVCTDYVTATRVHNSSYMTDVTSDGVTEGADWYYAMGSRQDYMMYFANCRETTIELSIDKTLSSDELPAFWTYNFEALINFIKPAIYGFNGTVKNTSNQPLDAKIEIATYDQDNSHVFTDPVNGDYYRPIEPGTYSVTYSSYGYISQTIEVTVNNWTTATIQNVVLEQAPVTDLTGVVTEEGSGNPLENVKIELIDTPVDAVYTNASGAYEFTGIMEDTYQIKASKAGYSTQMQEVVLSGGNLSDINFALSVSNAESFETGVPTYMTDAGNLPWTRVSTGAYDGTYCMKSGAITHSQESTLQIVNYPVSVAGNISFYKKVSCENGSSDNWDYLIFKVDGTEKERWDGEVDWSQESYAVTTGTHTFTWTYHKDGSADAGEDCAWLDYLELPQTVSDTNFGKLEKTLNVYPNPFKNFAAISFTLSKASHVLIQIFDINGKVIQIPVNGKMNSGNQLLYIYPQDSNGQKLMPGVYFYKITSSEINQTGKLVVE